MNPILLWNFLIPSVCGVLSLIVVVSLYIANDYCGWKFFWKNKYRARVFHSARLTMIAHGALITGMYGLSVGGGMRTFFEGGQAHWLPKLLLIFVLNAFLVSIFYRWADEWVERSGKFGPRRPSPRDTGGQGYPVIRPNRGSGHYY
jgi:hypothetical protein